MIPYSRPKLSDLYTLSQSKLLENHTLHSGTHLYSPYMAVSPPGAVRDRAFVSSALRSVEVRDMACLGVEDLWAMRAGMFSFLKM